MACIVYETFYNLNSNPFRLIPDPRFCFAHASHKEARAYLEYALKLGEGFIMVTGRPGTGKTTLIEAFIEELDICDVVVERVVAGNLDAEELLRAVAYAFDISAEGTGKATLRRQIQQFFTGEVQSGRRALLIIDEAQGLAHAALEELRLLADLKNGTRPLLQLFLVGQDSLRDLMRLPEMEQFQQRLIGTCHLEPLDLKDTRGYLEHRLRRAGWTGDPEISGEAIVSIYRHSKGVPRHINKTCTRLLLHGYMAGKHELKQADVLTITRELRAEELGPLESNQAVFPAIEDRSIIPELEDGCLAISDLALRADSEAAEQRSTLGHTMPEAGKKPPAYRAGRQVTARRARAVINTRHGSRSVKRLSDWWPHVIAVQHIVQKLCVEAAQTWRGRLGEQRGLAMKLGAVAVAIVFMALLMPRPDDGDGTRNAALAMHSDGDEPLLTQAVKKGTADGLRRNSDRQQQLWLAEETLPLAGGQAPVAVTLHNGQDDKPVPVDGASRRAGPKPMTPAAATGQGSVVPGITPPAQVDSDRGRKQLVKTDQPLPAHLSLPRDQDVSLQGAPAPENGKGMEDSPAEMDDSQHSSETELATLIPVEHPPLSEQKPAKPDAADDNAQPPATAREQKIDQLLSLGHQALSEDRLLIPPDNNAYHYYRQILTLEPGNTDANDGIEQIVRRYIYFASRALDREDEEKTRRYIRRGLSIQPEDQRLLTLQDRMNNWLARLEVEAIQKPVPPQVAESPPQEPALDFLSRLKAFFTKEKSKVQDSEYWEE